jgi:hypothetical protein
MKFRIDHYIAFAVLASGYALLAYDIVCYLT